MQLGFWSIQRKKFQGGIWYSIIIRHDLFGKCILRTKTRNWHDYRCGSGGKRSKALMSNESGKVLRIVIRKQGSFGNNSSTDLAFKWITKKQRALNAFSGAEKPWKDFVLQKKSSFRRTLYEALNPFAQTNSKRRYYRSNKELYV